MNKLILVFIAVLIMANCKNEIINQSDNPIRENPAQNQNEQMGKIISVYGCFTSQDIKNRADIPLQANIVVNGSNVECSVITISNIKNALGESSTALGVLCTSPLVNKWSGFGPTEWYLVAMDALYNRVKTPYSMGNWAGYNHNAVPVGLMNNVVPTEFFYNAGWPTITLGVTLQRGELNWDSMGITHVKFVVKNAAGVVISSGVEQIVKTDNPTAPTTSLAALNISGWSGDNILTAKIYMSNAAGAEFGLWPNTTQWTITAKENIVQEPSYSFIYPGPSLIIAGNATITSLQHLYHIVISTKGYLDEQGVFQNYTGYINVVGKIYNRDTNVLLHTWDAQTNQLATDFSGTIPYDVNGSHRIDFIFSKP